MICLREIGNAMVAVCAQSPGVRGDDLPRRTLALFGGKRITDGFGARLSVALHGELRSGRLIQGADGVLTVP